MGVHGLWDIVAPSSRPVRVEALRNKKLAVDASIWIYQFLKAVRDSEGNQLKNSHIVGFFRRICKLIYFGIKPVFVFDGGVPALKRGTIQKRKEKREENKESIQQIAQKILAKRLQEYADGKLSGNKLQQKKQTKGSSKATRTEKATDELYFDAYYDDLVDTETQEQINPKKDEKESKMFRQQDEYDLPVLSNGIKKDHGDNRLMTDYEYERLTKDINDGLDDIDLDNINPQSKEFANLPLSTQYIVLSHLRLRSRLRMGYTKTQLQNLFPDPMEFSKFQIKMVQKRNYFTQKIMNVTGMDGDANDDIISRRIASDKNRAYNLKRIGDGYALSISKQPTEGDKYEKPIFLEEDLKKLKDEEMENGNYYSDNSGDDDIDWDDVEVASNTGEVKDNTPVFSDSKAKYQFTQVKNPLFIQDSDNENSGLESDDKSIEMEDVTSASGINAMPETNKTADDDEVMKQIQYLYEYSAKHNKKNKPESKPEFTVISDDEDMDEYHEMQIKQFEEEELRMAVEKSKSDYLNSLDEEKNGKTETNALDDKVPIILSTSSLAKTLKLPNFSMKNNLLFGGSTKKAEPPKKQTQKPIEISDDVDLDDEKLEKLQDLDDRKDRKGEEEGEKEGEGKKKPLPLPEWFTNASSFEEPEKKDQSEKRKPVLTNDEKAGLISYGEAENYFSSDDDNDLVFDDVVSTTKNDVVNLDESEDSNDASISGAGNSNNVIALDDDDDDEETDAVSKPVINDDHSTFYSEINETSNHSKNPLKSISPDKKRNIPENNGEIDLNDNIKTITNKKSTESKGIMSILKTNDDNGTSLNNQANQSDDESDDVFSDEDEVNLLLDMEDEGSSYNNFVDSIQHKSSTQPQQSAWSIDDEARFQEQLRKQKRDSDEVSTKMIYDVQDLLSRFGIPFITAPMEAEAQCAELKLLGLVDGIITDDSDCFLFGGDRIYKNLFNDKHFVECYQNSDIYAELGLTRNNMIELAILLGSDYTEGIKGVGKVTAMEILGEFKTLENFRSWWVDYQNGIIDTTTDTPIRKKIRKKLSKKLFIGKDFPNKLIYEAYIHPEVDHDKTQFKWGYPDLGKLRTFLRYYVGWNEEKVNEILSPVIKNMDKPQTSIEEFFSVDSVQRRRKLDMSKGILDATEKLKKFQKSKKNKSNTDETDIHNNKRQKVYEQ